MRHPRRYPKAPITEAIIDLRVELPAGASNSQLETVHQGLEDSYPIKKNRNVATMQGEVVGQTASASASSIHVGYIFTSSDSKHIFQARVDGFTMSRLTPYESWEPFRDEARRIWDRYRGVAKPARVTRLAVRFINRLDLPLPVRDLKEYLRTVPEISADLPQDLAGYFMQLRLALSDIQASLVINQAVIPPSRAGVVSVVLDNDIFRTEHVPQEEDGIWDFFELLRERKDEVFEASITDKTRELFK